MTRRSMQDLLKKLEAQEKTLIAAKYPIYGPVNNDRAADEMFDNEPGIDLNSPSHKKRKAMALLGKY